MKRSIFGFAVAMFAFILIGCPGGAPSQYDGVFFGLSGDYNYGITAGTGGRLASTTDGGDTFVRVNLQFDISQPLSTKTLPTPTPTPVYTVDWDMYDLNFKDGWTGIVVGDKGGMLRTWDAGLSWERIDLGLSTALRGIKWDLNLSAAYTYGDDGKAFKSYDDGLTWTPMLTPRIDILYGGCFLDANRGWMVGDNGYILETNDGGANWQEKTLQDTEAPIDVSGIRLRDCWWGPGGYGFIVGSGGTFLRTENDGANWARIDLGVDAEFRKINFKLDGSFGMMVGDPYIGRSLDWGKTWYSIPLSSGEPLDLEVKDVHLNIVQGWAVGEGDYLYRCQNLLNQPEDPEPPICIQTKITF